MDYRTSGRATKPAFAFRSPIPWQVAAGCALTVSAALVFMAFVLRTETLACTRESDDTEAVCSVSNSFAGVPIWPTRRFRATSLSVVVVSTSKDGKSAYRVRPDDRAEDDVDVVGGNEHAAEIRPPLQEFDLDTKRTAVAVETVGPGVMPAATGIALVIGTVVIGFALLYMRMRWVTGIVALYEDDGRVVLTTKRWFARPSVVEIAWDSALSFFSREEPHEKAVSFHWVGLRTNGYNERLLWRTFSAAGAKRTAERMNRALAWRARP